MVYILTWIFCAGSFLITHILIQSRGLLRGGRPIWLAVLLLVPTWMEFKVAAVRIDGRSMCALAYVIGVLRQPYREQAGRGWYFSDLFILLTIVAITISQFAWRSDEPLAPFDPCRDFALPYLVGRFFLTKARDIESILPAFCLCITALACYAIVEGVIKKNPMEMVLGRPWSKGEAGVGGDELDSLRWGLKRAYGPQMHPIYLGLSLAMLMPWAVEAAVQSWNRRGPRWWQLVPFLTLAAVVCTGSRAAQICSLIVLGTVFYQSAPRLRPFFLLLVAFGGIGFVGFRDEIVNWLQNYAEDTGGGDSEVNIRGVLYPYTGTKHRDLLFIVYEEAYDNAGWLGYGSMIRKLPRDANMDKRFISIDNHYLMFYLQYGYIGITAFGLLAASVLWNLLPPFLNAAGPPGRIAGGLFGAVAGCLIAMRSVWFAPDYAWVWLFCAGLTVSLARLHRESRVDGALHLG